ncbi:Cuticle protein 6 [Dufourea novaeangliae]|uniref:Cuticle protein 6 n=1 Tax=Dufourea novaeangliae TaxID=178035 RepID=A0A154P7G4_DUFNO|nr:Cuticle protein 6 [Dufourea novaeangliae]
MGCAYVSPDSSSVGVQDRFLAFLVWSLGDSPISAVILLSICCLLSSGLAKPAAPLLNYQDSKGQYSFGYSAPDSARSEIRTLNGETRGAYSYIDDAGVVQSAQYTADTGGFRIAATNLPQAPLPVQDTQEVIAAREAHLEAQKLATGARSGEEMKIDGSVPESPIAEVIKITENGVLLKELKDEQKPAIESGEKIPMGREKIEQGEASLKEVKLENSGEMKISGKGQTEENLKAVAKDLRADLPLKDATITRSTPASTTILSINADEIKGLKAIDTKTSTASVQMSTRSQEQDSTTIDASQGTIAPFNTLPLRPTYPTIIKYAIPIFIF